MKLDLDQLDFDRCEDEPIHIPETIQSYGFLFALEMDKGTIQIYSQNVKRLISGGDNPQGQCFFDFLEDEESKGFILDTYEKSKSTNVRLPLRLLFKKTVLAKDVRGDFYAVVYNSGEYFVIEIEPASEYRESYSARHHIKLYESTVAPKFSDYSTVREISDEIVKTIRYITDMERVVLLKFNEDDSGKVIAESMVDDLDSYMGLSYPAGDIPAQARKLYTHNWVRLTPDTELEPSKLVPTPSDSDRKPLDLSQSLLRSLSPIHLQYVRNQGLRASMSLSLVTHGKLWGMISCHSRKPRYIHQDTRLQCENLSQLFSWQLYAKEEEILKAEREAIDRKINRILEEISPSNPIGAVFRQNEQPILELMQADGFIFYKADETITIGLTPDLPTILQLSKVAFRHGKEHYATEDASDLVDNVKSLHGIRGALFITLVENSSYFTAWFRKEKRHTQKWAGLPAEEGPMSHKENRLVPRRTFEVRELEVVGKSEKWGVNGVAVAIRFNKLFLANALKTQEMMQQNIVGLELQNKYKNEFLATLAHELRNPLTPVVSGISLLENLKDDAIKTEVLSMMKRQVENMTTMIDDLMDVSRITQGKIRLDKKDIALHDVLKDALENCMGLIEDKGHRLEQHIPSKLMYIFGDRMRLAQVFVNLLNNAAKYTPEKGKITLEAEVSNGYVHISIGDNGIGIPPEQLQNIFEMFNQMDAFSYHVKGGLGIGLTLVKKLVSMHNGYVRASSKGEGQGSIFEVVLPLSDSNSKATVKKADSVASNTNMGSNKLLLVDDNEDIISLLSMLLEGEGYKVRTAASGEEALEVFDSFLPDLAIFDIGLPGMNGYELCEQLSAREDAANTVFISQSGWGNKEEVDRALAVGFSEHLVKPVSVENILRILKGYRK